MPVDDLEFEEALPLLSVAQEAHDPGGLSRRRFLQAAVAASVGLALPALRPRDAMAAEAVTRLAPNEGVLVHLFLGGGNDGLNTVAPISGAARGHYEGLRPGLALPAASLLPVGGGWGLHPALDGVHARFRAGRVALVEGTGLPVQDLSHFTASARIMQGSVSTTHGTGWLGRFLDGLPDGAQGVRGLSVSSAVPMTLVGERAKVTSVPSSGDMWGADRTPPGEAALMDAVTAFAAAPTGLGAWGDSVARSGARALAEAQTLKPAFTPDPGSAGVARDLMLAARLINLDVGARVVGVTFGGWDTHAGQATLHEAQLKMLDEGIQRFFDNLAPTFRNRVTMLVQTEFGRRPGSNASSGTDHGNPGPMLVLGENVRGGRHGAPPALDRLDDRGNAAATVDFRAVYASILDRWLGADARQVLGGSFGGLDLFRSAPGMARA